MTIYSVIACTLNYLRRIFDFIFWGNIKTSKRTIILKKNILGKNYMIHYEFTLYQTKICLATLSVLLCVQNKALKQHCYSIVIMNLNLRLQLCSFEMPKHTENGLLKSEDLEIRSRHDVLHIYPSPQWLPMY